MKSFPIEPTVLFTNFPSQSGKIKITYLEYISEITNVFKIKNDSECMKKYLIDALDNFKNKKILVMGDVMLDKFSFGEINRVNPEQPAAPLVRIIKENYILGGAANVANNIVALGANCTLYCVLGRDFCGKMINKICENKKIRIRGFFNNNPTIMKQRVIAHGQQISRMDFGERKIKKINERLQNKIIDSLKKEIKNYDFVILSDYDKSFFTKYFSSQIINLTKESDIPILADPKPCNLDFFRGCSLISPNKKEAEEMTGIKYSNEKNVLTKMAEELSKKIESKNIIITCGEDGVFDYCDGETDFVGTVAREVADVTGAGDTFAAIIALGLASGLNISDAIRLGNYASGIVVGKIGTATTNIKEIKEILEKDNN